MYISGNSNIVWNQIIYILFKHIYTGMYNKVLHINGTHVNICSSLLFLITSDRHYIDLGF